MLLTPFMKGCKFFIKLDRFVPTSGKPEVIPTDKPPTIPPMNLPIAVPTDCNKLPPSLINQSSPGI